MLPLKWQRRAHEHSQTFLKHAQLTLHSTNLVHTDKAHFGDACLPVAANAFRVEGMNINDLPLSKDYTQSHYVVRAEISDQAQQNRIGPQDLFGHSQNTYFFRNRIRKSRQKSVIL
jgi:hypothetical protein